MFPWLLYLREAGGGRLSDIEYLSIKEFGSKLVQNDGTRTTAGDLCTLTASSGKDMYLAGAKINFRSLATPPSITVTLDVDTVVIETAELELTDTSESGDYEFVSKGFKVAATKVIKLEVTAIASMDVQGQLICFEETTGESPAI